MVIESWLDEALAEAVEDYKDCPDRYKANRLAHLCTIRAGYPIQGETAEEYRARLGEETPK